MAIKPIKSRERGANKILDKKQYCFYQKVKRNIYE